MKRILKRGLGVVSLTGFLWWLVGWKVIILLLVGIGMASAIVCFLGWCFGSWGE